MSGIRTEGISARAGIGIAAEFHAVVVQKIRAVRIDDHSLVLVREGTKGIGDGTTLPAGAMLALRAGTACDIGNLPDPASGRYWATLLVFPPDMVADFLAHYPLLAKEAEAAPYRVLPPEPDFFATARRAAEGLGNGAVSDVMARHRMMEVLVGLTERGVVWPVGAPTTERHLRQLIGARPGWPWSAADAARSLGVSEPTLRRRLAAEGTSFRAVLAEARLVHGLTLLQTTRCPITQVALDCGYESPSRFAARFRDRFGLSPSELRGE